MNDDDKQLIALGATLKALEAHRRSLIESKADEDVIRLYGSLIRYLSRLPRPEALRMLTRTQKVTRYASDQSKLPLKEATTMSLEKIERALADESTPRKTLEAIAVARFHFPRGSLRSLSNLEMLRQKLWTLLRNERSHKTIISVARRIKG